VNSDLEHQQTQHVDIAQTTAIESLISSVDDAYEIPCGATECDAALNSFGTNDTTSVPALPGLGCDAFDWNAPNNDHENYVPGDDAPILLPTRFEGSIDVTRVESTPSQDFMTTVQLMTYAPFAIADAEISRSLNLNLRSLWPRPKLSTGAQITANHMARILSSYPRMMQNQDIVPPFIHPQWISLSGTEPILEPLANCVTMIRMLSAGGQGSGRLFWRNVRMECDRISSIHNTLNEIGLLAAMQALLVYVLIRLSEGETEDNNHDAALLGTIAILLHDFHKKMVCSRLRKVVPETIWNRWIGEESRQRMGVIFHILNMLVCLEPATACAMQPGLLLAPLPAHKRLWEAKNDEQWAEERRKRTELSNGFGLTKNGELVTLAEYQMKLLAIQSTQSWTNEKTKANWEEWCSGMDGFGSLIMLTASLQV
jgi:hypothetical protein